MSHILSTARPQPVRIMAVVLAVLGFLTGAAGIDDLIPKAVMAWLVIIYGAIQLGWGAWTASKVTPLAAPQTSDGRALVPLGTPGTGANPAPGEAGYTTIWTVVGALLAAILVIYPLTLLF